MLAATKQLKIVLTTTVPGRKHGSSNNHHDTPIDAPNDSPPPQHPCPPWNDQGPGAQQDPQVGDIIYAAEGLMPMPKGNGRRFCAAFLQKGAAC